jgi:hypothetical protein
MEFVSQARRPVLSLHSLPLLLPIQSHQASAHFICSTSPPGLGTLRRTSPRFDPVWLGVPTAHLRRLNTNVVKSQSEEVAVGVMAVCWPPRHPPAVGGLRELWEARMGGSHAFCGIPNYVRKTMITTWSIVSKFRKEREILRSNLFLFYYRISCQEICYPQYHYFMFCTEYSKCGTICSFI